jgi:transposase
VGTERGLSDDLRVTEPPGGRAPARPLPAAVEQAQTPAFTAFADGVRLWRAEPLAYFDEPTTNGYAEGVINKVKLIKRRAYGLPSFDGFRERVVLACA